MKAVKMNRIQEFYDAINSFSKGISIWHIFKDFLLLAALHLANTVKTSEWDTWEEQYFSLPHTYQEEDQKWFPRLLASLSLGLMCYLQLSLLKMPGYVIIGDARFKPGCLSDNEVWYIPAFYMNALCFVDKSAEEGRKCGQAADGSKLTLKPPADCVVIDRKLSFRL